MIMTNRKHESIRMTGKRVIKWDRVSVGAELKD
jgi:hypothetical protein